MGCRGRNIFALLKINAGEFPFGKPLQTIKKRIMLYGTTRCLSQGWGRQRRNAAGQMGYPIVGMTNSGSSRMPEGQRVVMVLRRV